MAECKTTPVAVHFFSGFFLGEPLGGAEAGGEKRRRVFRRGRRKPDAGARMLPSRSDWEMIKR